MRFHVVSLPHTQTTRDYSNCAFVSLTRGFCKMMKSLGHEVIVYSGEDNDAECDEHVTCITKDEQAETFNVRGPDDILQEPLASTMWQESQPHWNEWNGKVAFEVEKRIEAFDFLCIIGGGTLFEPLLALAKTWRAICVEYAIGYAGISNRTHHAFGSSNWQHMVWGMRGPQHNGFQGAFYDRVIPHYFDPEDFEYREEKDDYLLYLGKLKNDKGVNVAARAAKAANRRIIFAGQGPTAIETDGDANVTVHRRRVGPDERRELLAGAAGVFVPSLYSEPFGMIAVEALLSGTPIITTPWGGLGDINVPGQTGFVCNTLQDFVDAARGVDDIDPPDCASRGMDFSENVVRFQYAKWFSDLTTLYTDTGWDHLR